MAIERAVGSKLSITCVIHSLDGGGAERVMAGLASRLAGRGHDVTLVTLEGADRDRYPVDARVRRVVVDNTNTSAIAILRVLQRIRRLRTAITGLNGDVILSFCDRTNIDVILAVGRLDTPVVVSERSDPAQQSLGAFWNAVRRIVYPRASQVIALTETSADYLRPFCRGVSVIPSAIAVPNVFSDRGSAQARTLVVAAGRLAIEKGFDRLLSAFARATEDAPQWRLKIFGDGPLRDELCRQSDQLGIANRVEFPGWSQPLEDQIKEATLFCLSSRYEGFPSVLLEAMSLGVPALSVDCESGPREIIEHEQNGLLVESSIAGLTDGLARMMHDDELREQVGSAGRRVVERFGWEAMVDRYESVLRDAAQIVRLDSRFR